MSLHKLSYILAVLFSMVLEGVSSECWKVSSAVRVFKNVGKMPMAKSCCPVSVFSVVIKVFENLVNNRLVVHLDKCCHFSEF